MQMNEPNPEQLEHPESKLTNAERMRNKRKWAKRREKGEKLRLKEMAKQIKAQKDSMMTEFADKAELRAIMVGLLRCEDFGVFLKNGYKILDNPARGVYALQRIRDSKILIKYSFEIHKKHSQKVLKMIEVKEEIPGIDDVKDDNVGVDEDGKSGETKAESKGETGRSGQPEGDKNISEEAGVSGGTETLPERPGGAGTEKGDVSKGEDKKKDTEDQ